MPDQYHTPPTIDPTLTSDINNMVKSFESSVDRIAFNLLSKALVNSGVTNPKVGLNPLIQLINTIIVPTTHKWEGTWVDHPNDSGGPTMRGVILNAFVSSFDDIFIATGVEPAATAARAFNSRYPKWKSDKELGKKVLYLVNNNTKVAGLFVYKFLASKAARYPIAVMTEDPWLGYFFAECVWGSGPAVYQKSRSDFDGLALKYGWNGNAATWNTFLAGLGDNVAKFATDALVYRYNHIMRISQPESKNAIFRKGWLRRLLDGEDSKLGMLIKLNEIFNLNSKSMFKFTPSEAQHLSRVADIYKTINLSLPD
jgi:hypothetical protein